MPTLPSARSAPSRRQALLIMTADGADGDLGQCHFDNGAAFLPGAGVRIEHAPRPDNGAMRRSSVLKVAGWRGKRRGRDDRRVADYSQTTEVAMPFNTRSKASDDGCKLPQPTQTNQPPPGGFRRFWGCPATTAPPTPPPAQSPERRPAETAGSRSICFHHACGT